MNKLRVIEATALATALTLSSCSSDEKVDYSESVTCDELIVKEIGEFSYRATVGAAYQDINSTEKIIQVEVNWGTTDEAATTLGHADDLWKAHEYDFTDKTAVNGGNTYKITAFMFTKDTEGTIRFVDSGPECTYELELDK